MPVEPLQQTTTHPIDVPNPRIDHLIHLLHYLTDRRTALEFHKLLFAICSDRMSDRMSVKESNRFAL